MRGIQFVDHDTHTVVDLCRVVQLDGIVPRRERSDGIVLTFKGVRP